MKNIFVTGISNGLGYNIAKVLLSNKYNVYGIYRKETKQLQSLKVKYSENLKTMVFDLSNTVVIKKEIFKEFIPTNIPIHGFVNNAAIAYDDLISNLNMDSLNEMYNVNVFSPFMIVKEVIRKTLLHKNQCSIIHISSISAHTGYKGLSMYASTKGALEAFSKNTAREWGKHKIRSNTIVCGFMETNMSAALSNEQKERIYNRTALKKATNPQCVSNMIQLLLSEDSLSITGQDIFIDSGTI
jgi:3-oxoacyl-[acyl-carrier protein] reductase